MLASAQTSMPHGAKPLVLALDLSLTCSGYAVMNPSGVPITSGAIKTTTPSNGRECERLISIRNKVESILESYPAIELCAIEGYAMGIKGGMVFSIGELGGVIRTMLWERKLPFVAIAPSSVKKWATGKGVAQKDAMVLSAERRWSGQVTDNNQADALWIADIARHIHGRLEPDTQYRSEVLAAIRSGK